MDRLSDKIRLKQQVIDDTKSRIKHPRKREGGDHTGHRPWQDHQKPCPTPTFEFLIEEKRRAQTDEKRQPRREKDVVRRYREGFPEVGRREHLNVIRETGIRFDP